MSELFSHRTTGMRAFGNAYLHRRYAILFYSLLLIMVVIPLSAALDLTGALIEFFLAATLVVAIVPIDSTSNRLALMTLTVLIWLARPVTVWLNHPGISAMTLGLWTLIALFAAARALRFAMAATQVDAEHLYAALSAYLMAGVFFGLSYWALEEFRPGTFGNAGQFTRMSALYFSFVTLATLGYGDIVPRTDIARGLAIIEGVGGQLFLAVLVARLVSLYARGGPERRS